MARHKISWPIARHTIPKPDFNKDKGLFVDLFLAHDRTSGPLWDDFVRQTKAIDENPKLTALGKDEARKELAEKFRASDDVQRHRENVAKGKARISELIAELTAPKVPKELSPYEQVMLANQHDRAIRRFESVPVEERHRVLRAAMQARDVAFLRPIHDEPGLLNEQDARRVRAILLEGADPVKFKELTELAGRFDGNGESDPLTSAVAVADYSVGQLLEEVDRWAGLDRITEDAKTMFSEQLKTPNAPLTMTAEEAHDPRIYKAGRELAAQHGRVLSISGDENVSMEPPAAGGAGDDAGGNGSGT